LSYSSPHNSFDENGLLKSEALDASEQWDRVVPRSPEEKAAARRQEEARRQSQETSETTQGNSEFIDGLEGNVPGISRDASIRQHREDIKSQEDQKGAEPPKNRFGIFGSSNQWSKSVFSPFENNSATRQSAKDMNQSQASEAPKMQVGLFGSSGLRRKGVSSLFQNKETEHRPEEIMSEFQTFQEVPKVLFEASGASSEWSSMVRPSFEDKASGRRQEEEARHSQLLAEAVSDDLMVEVVDQVKRWFFSIGKIHFGTLG